MHLRNLQFTKFLLLLLVTLVISLVATMVSLAAVAPSQVALIVVPRDVPELQVAINQIGDGGVIEMQAGTYAVPTGGFHINDLPKSFSIRATVGAEVVLDGGNSKDILRFQNTTRTAGKLVTFEGLTFANGKTTTEGVAGAVTIYAAEGLFSNCIFKNNSGQQSSTGGGAIVVARNSSVSFLNSQWLNNTAKNEGGGLNVQDSSIVNINNSQFVNNRVDLPNHRVTAAGGGIHVGNSQLYVYNTLFDGNRAGYVGGAIYVIGSWADSPTTPSSFAYIANSTFRNNAAMRDASVTFGVPTEGGAIAIEDQATAQIYNSSFNSNSAQTGGAIDLYRAIVSVDNSVFQDNLATGTGPATGFGAAISAISNDAKDASTNNGAINRRSSQIIVNNSVFTRNNAAPSQTADGIYLAGDTNRAYGLNGVSKNGSAADNWAKATVTNSIFQNTDVKGSPGVPGSGVGGAITSDLGNVSLQDVVITSADAIGDNSSGGGIALLDDSVANMNKITIVGSSSEKFGGAIFVQGSTINLNNCTLLSNEISPGVAETAPFSSYGAAIFTGVDEGRQLSARGTVSNCIFNNNIGLPIFDDDRNSIAVNAIQYNSNKFHATQFSGAVYLDSLVGPQTVDQLNALIVSRQSQNTDKATTNNVALSTAPTVGLLMTTHTGILSSGDDPYYLAYAWSGRSATLDGQPLSSLSGLKLCSIKTCSPNAKSANHTLQVDGETFSLNLLSLADLSQKVYLPLIRR